MAPSHRSYVSAFVVLAGLALASLAGCGGGPAVVPSSYGSYNSKDGTFAVDTPDKWEITGGGKQGPVWAKFASGNALVDIKADLTGSLLGDIAQNAAGPVDPGQVVLPQDEPVHKIHMMALEKAQADYKDYAETAASPSVLSSQLGPARLSEFTYKSSFGTAMHGYRVTILGHDKRVVVYCVAPEAEWSALKPSFDAILASMERGQAEI